MSQRPNQILDDLARIRRELTALSKMKISVGVQSVEGTNIHGDNVSADNTLLMIGSVHEYGCTIKMTDKMRRYLGAMGLFSDGGKKGDEPPAGHQKGYVNIPERSYIRAFFDTNKNRLYDTANEAISEMLQGKIGARQAAEEIGKAAVELTVGMMGANSKAVSEFAADHRKQNKTGAPLYDTGNLQNHITYVIEE